MAKAKMWDPYADFETSTLDNGLTVCSLKMNRPWQYFGVVVHAGSREDFDGKEGLAHFVEHRICDDVVGADKEELVRFVADKGGWVDYGTTNFLSSRYSFFMPADKKLFRKPLDFFARMLLEAKFINDIETERNIIYNEFRENYPFDVDLRTEAERRSALYHDHPLSKAPFIIGSPASIRTIKNMDLTAFYKRYYTPVNMTIVSVGGFSHKALINLISGTAFNSNNRKKRNNPQAPYTDYRLSLSDNFRRIRMSDFMNVRIEMSRYLSYAALPAGILSRSIIIFRNMFLKIINNELREKRGLTYGIKFTGRSYQDLGEICINIKIDPSATEEIHNIVELCLEEVLEREDLFLDSIRSGKNSLILQDNSGEDLFEGALSDISEHHKIILLQELLEEYDKVQFSDIERILSYIKSNRWTNLFYH